LYNLKEEIRKKIKTDKITRRIGGDTDYTIMRWFYTNKNKKIFLIHRDVNRLYKWGPDRTFYVGTKAKEEDVKEAIDTLLKKINKKSLKKKKVKV
jgi:hypothetical protein